ncbi:MAG TPA: Ig-like domain repeat protein [Casimicrobiaceae bacterium]|nr:Ig-like domain repeat protein [Casimicrobiaceae bacterium]
MNGRPSPLLSSIAPLGALALAVVFCMATPARAGGPLDVVNHQPVVYANGGTNLKLNVDQGPLGTRTNAQAVALVQNAIGLWNAVPTSTMRLTLGVALATDYNRSNYSSIFNNFSDGFNPVIFDTDGSITDAIFGAGAKSSILGFAGSAYFTSGASAGKFAEGRAVLNGSINVSDGLWTVVLAHEFGHFFGLDHSQIDNMQGMAQNNYVLMYPIAYRTLVSLHEDDVAAVTSLYPSASASGVYGQLTGNFTSATGTPILGANIWAKEVSTGKAYSVVSDFLMQGTGFFRLLLPAGTYTLNAESIDSGFTGGSAVGPYASSSNDISFKPPHPITPVALGGASPQRVAITPGCVATATFRLNGSGSVSGNCGSVPSSPAATTTTLASSANPAAVGALVTLTATVAGTTPTGTVSFKDSGTSIAACAGVSLTAAGTAVCNTSALVAGVHSIVAAYSGDAANASSSSAALSQVVNAAAQTNALSNGVPVTGLSGSTNTELRYTLSVPAGATTLSFRTTGGSGNTSLFVKFGSPPTTASYSCRSVTPGTTESCGFTFPRSGTYYVLVRGATAFAGVTLTATFR